MNLYAGTYNGQIFMLSGHPASLMIQKRNQISQNSIRAMYLPTNSQELLCGGFESEITAVNRQNLSIQKQTKQPRGIINCIYPVNNNIVAVGHQNGLIRFWDWKNWNQKKQIRQHKKSVNQFCIDKNKVLFFSAAGKSLILWDNVKYEKVFHYKFDYDIEHVLIDETMTYILLINKKQIHQILAKNNEEVAICKINDSQMIQTALIFKDFVIVGGDKGNIFIYNLSSYQHKIYYQAHSLRVKCMKIQTFEQIDYLITASTNGEISTWDILQFLKQVETIQQDYNLDGLKPLSTLNLNTRIICVQTALIQTQPIPEQNKLNQQIKNRKSNNPKVNKQSNGKRNQITKENNLLRLQQNKQTVNVNKKNQGKNKKIKKIEKKNKNKKLSQNKKKQQINKDNI